MAIAFDIEAAPSESPFPLYGVPGLTPLSVSTYSEVTPLSRRALATASASPAIIRGLR
jgi:hypothetical protein